MKIILFVLLFISAQIEVYAQQKQSKKSWASRETPVELSKQKRQNYIVWCHLMEELFR